METLDKLPGESETKIVKKTRVRRCCDICGEDAHFKLTYLLPNARSNPASKGYLGDDISWCEDACTYLCRQHGNVDWYKLPNKEGYEKCSLFPANERFAHLFLEWQSEEIELSLIENSGDVTL